MISFNLLQMKSMWYTMTFYDIYTLLDSHAAQQFLKKCHKSGRIIGFYSTVHGQNMKYLTFTDIKFYLSCPGPGS